MEEPRTDPGRSRYRSLAFGILATLAVLAFCRGFATSRAEALRRACFCNQRTLYGFLEMTAGAGSDRGEPFLMDLPAGRIPEITWEFWKGAGFLPKEMVDPGFGPGSHRHYLIDPSGTGFLCTQHGAHMEPHLSPRALLRKIRVDDPELLAEAPEEVVPVSPGGKSAWLW